MKKVISLCLAVYLFVLNGPMAAYAAWTGPTTIDPAIDPGNAKVSFGVSVGIDGDNVIALDAGQDIPGIAYIYFYKDTGSETSIFSYANDLMIGYPYGVDISGDYAVAGLPGWDYNGYTDCGAVQLYKTTDGGSSWVADQFIGCPTDHDSDQFGQSVSLDGDLLIVGAPNSNSDYGSAHIYRESGGTWSLEGSIIEGTWQWGSFGWDVGISSDGDYAIIGAPYGDADGDGFAEIWHYNGSNWVQDGADLGNQTSWEEFGWSVAIDGTKAVVGARGAADGWYDGAAYFYTGPTTWSLINTFNGDSGETDYFGTHVDLSGDYAIVGATYEEPATDPGADSGAAYVYTWGGSSWAQDSVFYADPADWDSNYGNGVGISGTTTTKSIVIGQYNNSGGFAYTYYDASGGGGGAVPEFSDYMLILIIVIAVGLMLKTVPRITGKPISPA